VLKISVSWNKYTLQYVTKTFELKERLKLFKLEKSLVSAGKSII